MWQSEISPLKCHHKLMGHLQPDIIIAGGGTTLCWMWMSEEGYRRRPDDHGLTLAVPVYRLMQVEIELLLC